MDVCGRYVFCAGSLGKFQDSQSQHTQLSLEMVDQRLFLHNPSPAVDQTKATCNSSSPCECEGSPTRALMHTLCIL